MRSIKILLLTALIGALLCVLLPAFAAEEAFTFTLDEGGSGYSVTGYSGSQTAVVIPAEYLGLPVTAIGENAFQGNTTMESVAIPSSVTRIGTSSFKGCTQLTDISSYDPDQTLRIPGDADGNGTVDLRDVLQLLCYDANDETQIHFSNADVNADGAADLHDALLIMQHQAGWDVKLQ